MMETQAPQTLTLQVSCLASPLSDDAGQPVEFGLQDQKRQLLAGIPSPDGSLRYRCTATTRPRDGSAAPDFTGPFVHGKPGARFLYLSLRRHGASDWIRRIKIPLESLTWEQIKEATQPDLLLAVRVQGDRSGMVALLDTGWTVEKKG